jgi:diguanylate cyclase (GGDEF)-like protein
MIPMSRFRTPLSRRWHLVIVLSVVFLVLLLMQDVIREVLIFNQEIDRIEQELEDDIEEDVRDLVQTVVSELNYTISNLDENAALHAEDNLSDLLFATEAHVALSLGSTSAELTDDILQLVADFNARETNHIHSLYTLDGMELYDGFTNQATNVDKSGILDYFERDWLDDLLAQAALTPSNGELYQLEEGNIEKYKIHAARIDDLDLVLLSYVRLSTYSDVIKARTIAQLGELYAGAANSVFIVSTDGEILLHQNDEAIGLTVHDTVYPIWAQTIATLLEFSDTQGSGHLTYEFYSNYENGVIKRKIAYVDTITPWNVLVGASSDDDIYDAIIASYRTSNARTVLLVKGPTYTILLALGILIAWFVRSNVARSLHLLEEEKRLYQMFADASTDLIVICDKQGRIQYLNAQARRIIHGQRTSEHLVYFDQIMVEEEGYYILYGVAEERFVKYSIDDIEFDGKPADLYRIVDVTEKIETERKLEALSMEDELTALYNRRRMVKDYKERILPSAKNHQDVHLVMLDLDHFKPINDKYGHRFGDEVLCAIADVFLQHASDNVRIYRVGGDEFALFAIDLGKDNLLALIHAIQEDIQNLPFDRDLHVTISAGVTAIRIGEHQRRFSDFYERADRALYEAKQDGGNQIRFEGDSL